jgi:hypothetical protein
MQIMQSTCELGELGRFIAFSKFLLFFPHGWVRRSLASVVAYFQYAPFRPLWKGNSTRLQEAPRYTIYQNDRPAVFSCVKSACISLTSETSHQEAVSQPSPVY